MSIKNPWGGPGGGPGGPGGPHGPLPPDDDNRPWYKDRTLQAVVGGVAILAILIGGLTWWRDTHQPSVTKLGHFPTAPAPAPLTPTQKAIAKAQTTHKPVTISTKKVQGTGIVSTTANPNGTVTTHTIFTNPAAAQKVVQGLNQNPVPQSPSSPSSGQGNASSGGSTGQGSPGQGSTPAQIPGAPANGSTSQSFTQTGPNSGVGSVSQTHYFSSAQQLAIEKFNQLLDECNVTPGCMVNGKANPNSPLYPQLEAAIQESNAAGVP